MDSVSYSWAYEFSARLVLTLPLSLQSRSQGFSRSSYGINHNDGDFMIQSSYRCMYRGRIRNNGKLGLGRGCRGRLLRMVFMDAFMHPQKWFLSDLCIRQPILPQSAFYLSVDAFPRPTDYSCIEKLQ